MNISRLVIRQVPADQVVAAARQVGHSSTDVLASWDRKARADRLVMFAVYDGSAVVGSINILLDGAEEAPVIAEVGTVPMLNALGVNESYRRRGLGEQLLRRCEAYMSGQPTLPQTLALGVEPGNAQARALYERVGYQYHLVDGQELFKTSWPEFDANGQRYIFETECLLMVKDLA